MNPPKPCLHPRCPGYAYGDHSYCEAHQAGRPAQVNRTSAGTTPQWRAAREKALRRVGRRCEGCGKTEAEVRARGGRLEVHHVDGGGVSAQTHDQALLRVLCRPGCHTLTLRKPRPSLAERKAEIRARDQVT